MLDVLTIKFYLLSKPVTPVKMAIMVLVGLVVALFGILLFLLLEIVHYSLQDEKHNQLKNNLHIISKNSISDIFLE